MVINAANIITSLRIVFSIVLLFTNPLGAMFYACYLICGLSDVLDGFVARKFHMQTEFGAKLDSVSDVLFLIVVAVKVIPVLTIKPMFWVWGILIALLKLSNIAIIYKKHNTFGMLHTYSIKGCGVIMWLAPFFLTLLGTDVVLLILCIACSISTLEETVINIYYKDLNLNRKHLLDKR